jgi:hypothetical protein
MARRGIAQTAAASEAAKGSDRAAHVSMTDRQVARLKALSEAAYELDAFSRNLSQAEAARRIAVLTAKLRFLDGPPHTL